MMIRRRGIKSFSLENKNMWDIIENEGCLIFFEKRVSRRSVEEKKNNVERDKNK